MMGHGGGGGGGGAMMGHAGGGGGGVMMGHGGGGAMMGRGGGAVIHDGGFARGNMMAMRHDRDFGRDHHFDRDHDRFRFRRFFPGFAFGFDTYADVGAPYFEDCFVLHRVWTRFGWRLRRAWVCG